MKLFFHQTTTKKFSVLGDLRDDFKVNNMFEFILEYPNLGEELHWKQTKNPIEYYSKLW